jgi:putative transposase
MYALAVKHGYTPHIRSRGQEIEQKVCTPGWRARRWVVEATHSWLNRNRAI